ncbi:MAG: family 78 glycoside hydrolase catalytic domain [Clostridia bacterium]|nr:family 78 glycoside hydrolase catalytic domain [Clostridia bacterium]
MENTKWIWENTTPQADEYAEFLKEFNYTDGKALLNISADSDFVCFVNGVFVANGQSPDYPWAKVYDSIDITKYCKVGKNKLSIIVWYYGIKGTATYYPSKAGLWFNITDNSGIIAVSDEETLSRISNAYINHRKKIITGQVGLSFCYDANMEDYWINIEVDGFHKSVLSDNDSVPELRSIKRPVLSKCVTAKFIKKGKNNRLIFDLGAEQNGYITFKLNSPKAQKLIISYGEHLADGKVRRIIDSRDFSVEYIAKKGDNIYTNYFRRLGCRYIEIQSLEPISVDMIGIIPRGYPVSIQSFEIKDELRKQIYNTSIRTLILCMNDHYEDCPWREQAMYVMDSRNQMLCGYIGFGEFEFAKANLKLMAQDRREDGILNMTFPAKFSLTIPSFSLHYFTAVAEYTKYSGDKTLARELYPRLEVLLKAFTDELTDNFLIPDFKGEQYWNFYEWSKDLSGHYKNEEKRIDLSLNCLLVIALKRMQEISQIIGVDAEYGALADKINISINKTFWNNSKKLYKNSDAKYPRYSELGQSLAILCGAAELIPEAEDIITDRLKKKFNRLIKATLSMSAFKYDALIKVDKKNIYWVLEQLDKNYSYMLSKGATSFWETIKGQKDFDKAGSLCHGWSAIPVYYYHLAKQQGIDL